jgi:hypothetical protein
LPPDDQGTLVLVLSPDKQTLSIEYRFGESESGGSADAVRVP